jgi:hypothetical protein
MSYTFDDDNQSQIDHYADLQALGVPLTFYMWTNRTQAMNSVWTQAVKDGHEIGNHTNTHPSTFNSSTAANDIDTATTFIKNNLKVTPYTFAAPNGTNGASGYSPFAQTRFLIDRGVSDGVITTTSNSDAMNTNCWIPAANLTSSTTIFSTQVDDARSKGGWRCVVVHGFQGASDSAYQPVPLDAFVAGVQHAKTLGDVWIGRMMDVAAYWLGQKAFASAMTMTSGTDKTWTWTLPSNFPPNHYLRVTVDGGTLKQGGTALTWDSHGYYEISLDAGSVTLSP